MKTKPSITGEFLYSNHPNKIDPDGYEPDWKDLSKEAKASWNELAATTCRQIAQDILRSLIS